MSFFFSYSNHYFFHCLFDMLLFQLHCLLKLKGKRENMHATIFPYSISRNKPRRYLHLVGRIIKVKTLRKNLELETLQHDISRVVSR
jgi:hypothetical protein